MALLTPDLVEEWNKAINARRAYFVLDYTTHYPMLIIGSQNCDPEPWIITDTRKKLVLRHPVKNPELQLIINDINERFKKLGAIVTMGFNQDMNKKRSVSLKILAEGGGPVSTVLLSTTKGSKTEPFGQFALNERW